MRSRFATVSLEQIHLRHTPKTCLSFSSSVSPIALVGLDDVLQFSLMKPFSSCIEDGIILFKKCMRQSYTMRAHQNTQLIACPNCGSPSTRCTDKCKISMRDSHDLIYMFYSIIPRKNNQKKYLKKDYPY